MTLHRRCDMEASMAEREQISGRSMKSCRRLSSRLRLAKADRRPTGSGASLLKRRVGSRRRLPLASPRSQRRPGDRRAGSRSQRGAGTWPRARPRDRRRHRRNFESLIAGLRRRKSTSCAADRRRMEWRKFADQFEGALGRIVKAVSSSADELHAVAGTLMETARTPGARRKGRGRVRRCVQERVIGILNHGRDDVVCDGHRLASQPRNSNCARGGGAGR